LSPRTLLQGICALPSSCSFA